LAQTTKREPETVATDAELGVLEPAVSPQPAVSPETAVSAEYVAAHLEMPATAPSGGDFHDTFPLPDGSGDVVVVVGDIAGHGPEQTAQAEHMRDLLSGSLESGFSPAETLDRVNEIAERDPAFERFGTVFVGTLEAGTGKLTYASGGHEPALITAVDDGKKPDVEELLGTGPPVGAFPPELARYDEHETILPVDGTLLVYTDGLPDARSARSRRDYFGLARLKRTLAQIAAFSPRKLVTTLLQRVAAFCRGRFHDDVLVMAVRRTPAGAASAAGEPARHEADTLSS
jgi:serine phosphatase RsbU (regulator of sigma subunit)